MTFLKMSFKFLVDKPWDIQKRIFLHEAGWEGGVFWPPFKKKEGRVVRKNSFLKEKVLKICHQN